MKTDTARIQSPGGSGSLGRRKGFRLVIAGLFLLITGSVAVRLLSHHSPTIDILGSYFPSWMLCILSGVTLTVVTHWLIQAHNWKAYVSPGPLIYPCLFFIFTFLTWIFFYQN
jgi:YtcA family